MDIDGSYYCSKCMQTVDNDSLICPHCGYEPSNSATDSQHLAEGTFLKDRYLIGAVIGAGGFGVTYAAWDENLSVPVAIKEYFPIKYAHRNTEESDAIVAHDESRGLFALGLDRFRREAQVLAQFQNVPGIVNINECFDENETAYIAMEFVHGVPLDEYVREHRPSPKKLLEIMLPAINALEIIHRQGINHRDIKPDNLLVQADGSIKLIDFGSAREVEHVTNLIVVSDGYAPLEQYDLKQPQGPWVDVYGISATIYHMLTGVMPEASISRAKNDTLKAPSKLGVKLKKYQEKALMAGLAVDPQKRIQSIAEYRALLYNMPLPEEVRRRKAFVRRFITTAVLTVLLLAAVVVNFACGFPLGEGLLYSLYPDGWHVVGSYEQRSEITIPETKLSIPVSAIADSAFRDNQTVETVIIPGSVSSIGQYSFANCANLETAKIEDGVTTIGMGAFHSSGILGYISLPQTITTIGEYAFYNCDNLEAIFSNLDRELRIGDYAFSDCDQLTWLDFSYAAVVHIGNNAFRYCSKLREADLPFALEYIGDHAFEDCIKLEKFDLRLLVEEVPIIATYIGEYAFHNCESMTHFEFPRNVVHIGAGAFAYCCSLTNMMLPHDVTSIEDSTFEGCSSLTSISIPDDVISIGYATFEGCSSLTSITLPDDLTSIGAAAFKRCSSLVSITIPNGISRIESESFYGCSSLTHISIPDGLHYIGYGSFGECGSLASILIPDSVITIDSLALFDCSSLTSIIIPDGVTSIGAGAFSGCSSLTKITLPNGITLIERWAFSGCSSLVCINLPNTVTTIESDVFQGCSSLYSIFLPDSVTSIGNGVFSNCPSDLVITVDPYTYAAQFCQENNLNYVYTDELPET